MNKIIKANFYADWQLALHSGQILYRRFQYFISAGPNTFDGRFNQYFGLKPQLL